MPRKLVNVQQISEMLSVKPATIYKWVRQGKIPFYKLESLVRFDPDEVWGWVAKKKARRLTHPVDLDPRRSHQKPSRRI